MGFLVEQVYQGCITRRSNAFDTAEDISASVAVYGGVIIMKKCRIKRLMFTVTTLVAASVTPPQVEFNRRPTIASSSGEVLLGTIIIPNATSVGTVMYKDIEPVDLYPGDELSFEHTVQAVDGSAAAGAGFYGYELEADSEMAANLTRMTATA